MLSMTLIVWTHFQLRLIEIWLWPFTNHLLTPHTVNIWKTDIWTEFKWNSFVCQRTSKQHKNVSDILKRKKTIKLRDYIISETNKTVWVWTSFWPLQPVSKLRAVLTVCTGHAGLWEGEMLTGARSKPNWRLRVAQSRHWRRDLIIFSSRGTLTPCWAKMQMQQIV